MKLITLDWETYYDKEYSLSRLSTEDYVNDRRFEHMMVGIKIGNTPAFAHSGDKKSTREFLYDHRVHECALLCQNTMFDQLINEVHFGIRPPILMDTMAMAQAKLKPYIRSMSLASILKHLTLNLAGEQSRVKGSMVANMMGRRRESLSSDELAAYMTYNLEDVENTHWAFWQLMQTYSFPREELDVIDLTLRMYFDTKLELDAPLLAEIYDKVRDDKEELVAKLPATVQRADLMSNIKLAELLKACGVDPPMKVSPTTGKLTFAFAKNDPAWLDMVEEYADDPLVAPILAARQSEKSTIIETRAARLLEIAQRYPKFRVPLKYYAAHPGRYGGTQSINVQNFNRVKKLKRDDGSFDRRQIRFAIKAPKDHAVLAADLAQIEARLNAWESGCAILTNAFATGKDIYSEFATTIFRKKVSKGDPNTEKERFVGKTCILGLGYGMGPDKLTATLRKDKIRLDVVTAQEYVGTYRTMYYQIPAFWRYCEETLEIMAAGGKRRVGPCMASGSKIELPNGMELVYHNLRWVSNESYEGWMYDFGGVSRTLWGGKVVENITQALARIVITDAMRTIRKELSLLTSMQAHDELVFSVPAIRAQYYADAVSAIMIRRPWWAPDLPIAVEAKFGPTYGDAK